MTFRVRLLEAIGHKVDVVSDGACAVEAVQASAYDLVLMDIQMPGVDGLSATRQIRELRGISGRVPIVALTSCTNSEKLAQFKPAGIDGHLAKPYSSHSLYWIVEYWASAGPTRDIVLQTEESKSPLDDLVFDDLKNMVGAAKIKKLLQMLNDSFCKVIPLPPADEGERTAAGLELHNLVSQAGQIGFLELSNAARELGVTISGTSSATFAIANFETARTAARNEIIKRLAS